MTGARKWEKRALQRNCSSRQSDGKEPFDGGLPNGRSVASAGSAFRCKLLEERILIEKIKNERSELHAKMDGTGSK